MSLAALALSAVACAPFGQTPPPTLIPRSERTTWVGLGVGAGSAGWLAQGDVATVRGGRVLRARWNIQGDDGNWSGRTPKSVSEFSILAGKGRICCGGSQWGAFAIGAGILTGFKGSPRKDFTTVGMASELSLVTGRMPHIAPSVIANLNPEMPFVALNIAIVVGRVPFVSTQSWRR